MKNLIITSLCLFSLAFAFAGKGRHNFDPVKNYAREHIKPVIIEQRKKLDLLMDVNDKQKIKEIKIQLNQLKEKYQMTQVKGCTHKNIPIEQKKLFKNERKMIVEQLKPIAEKYKMDIEKLHQEIASSEQQWKTDLKSMAMKDSSQQTAKKIRHLSKKFTAIHFLLIDVEKQASEKSIKEFKVASSVSPNPSNGESILSFDLKKASQVNIQLYNQTGTKLAEISNKMLKPGSYSEPIKLHEYPAGIYIVHLIVDGHIQVLRLQKL